VKTDKQYHLLNRQRKHRIDSDGVRQFLSGLVREVGRPEVSFSVVFVTDKVMRAYNLRYRHMDKPTDVLSFRGEGVLGDILISPRRQGNKPANLRLFFRRQYPPGASWPAVPGYDHETDNGEMRMIERFEEEIGVECNELGTALCWLEPADIGAESPSAASRFPSGAF
jgi:ssRNA-specific RNase YbeY (16S rRNA maturation enzyme)